MVLLRTDDWKVLWGNQKWFLYGSVSQPFLTHGPQNQTHMFLRPTTKDYKWTRYLCETGKI